MVAIPRPGRRASRGRERAAAQLGAQGVHEASPFLGHGGAAQLAHHLQKRIEAHPHPQWALRQQQTPFAIADHRHRFPHGPQHLRQGVGAGPAAQAAPEGRTRLEQEAPPLEPVGRAAGLGVGLQHHHLQAVAGGDGGGAETTDATADNDQIRHRPPASQAS